MKITFEVIVASSFTYPPDDRVTNIHLWPVHSSDAQHLNVDIEFTPSSGDNMRDAEDALRGYMNKNYSGKDYKIYYWWWK